MGYIESIPTEYNGRMFRSRLEARTAKLLDDYGIEWVYEPEGLDCCGVWYLPDFYFPKTRTFLEVKGVVDNKALGKVNALARAANLLPAVGHCNLNTSAIELREDVAALPYHVVMVDPLSIDIAETGERLIGWYAPAAHSGLHGKWQGRFCVSAKQTAHINTCPECRVTGFLWSEGLPFCYGCGAIIGRIPEGPGDGADDISDECICGGHFRWLKVDRVPGVGTLRQAECDRCSHVRGEKVFPFVGGEHR